MEIKHLSLRIFKNMSIVPFIFSMTKYIGSYVKSNNSYGPVHNKITTLLQKE